MKIPAWSLLSIICFATACTSTKPVQSTVQTVAVKGPFDGDSNLQNAHVGVAVYDPAAGKYLYNYQGDKYFVPASNVKIVTCYAAMKYLDEKINGLAYAENDTAVYLIPTGDPTLLHPDFRDQPVIRFLQSVKKNMYITTQPWKSNAWGMGWSWDDYNDDYMAERSPLPVYGNVVEWVQENNDTSSNSNFQRSASIYSNPEVDWKVKFTSDTSKHFHVQRNLSENIFNITQGTERKASELVPFVTNGLQSALELLADTIGHEIRLADNKVTRQFRSQGQPLYPIESQPLDSMLKPMMYRSDNFFAEQSLQMVSYQFLHEMNDVRMIDTLLKTDLKDLPQKPVWADGSGLSRFNLFSPQDFVTILQKMEKEFGMERIKGIFPTGGSGTLKNYYRADSGFIYAKTGTLTGVVALSGFLYTKQKKLLIFSVLVNNHNGNAPAIRRKVEGLLTEIRNKN